MTVGKDIQTSETGNSSDNSRDTEIKTNASLTVSNKSQSTFLSETSKSNIVKEMQKELKTYEITNNLSHTSNYTELKSNIGFESNKSPLTQLVENSFPNDLPSQSYLLTKNCEDEAKDKYLTFPKSVPSSVNVNPNLVTAKFKSIDETFACVFKLTTTVKEIKKQLEYALELKEDSLILECNDIEAADFQTLADLGGQPYDKVTFKISSKGGDRGKAILTRQMSENIPTLDVITVHLMEKGDDRNLVVEIRNESVSKQWLGGYCNKLTGIKYHNAVTQTMKNKEVFKFDEVSGKDIPLFFDRDTQTPFSQKDKTADTRVNKLTQMSRSDLYITSENDKFITARPYHPFVPLSENNKLINIIIKIQRAVRHWIQIKRFMELIRIQTELWTLFKNEQNQILQEQADKERVVITSSAYPVKRDDFYMLYLTIEKCWRKEWKKICETKTLEPKKAASVLLLEKEIALLEAIEKHKIAGKSESLKREQMLFLERTSRPQVFRNSEGKLTAIDYLETQKAKEFKEMYSALVRKDVLPKDRIEFLIALKKSFESYYMDYEYANDLLSLISREIELLGIGMKLNDLRGLQKRIEQLFMDFLHQQEYNPAVSKYKKTNLPTAQQTFQCSRCLKLLPALKFTVHVRLKSYSQCKSCTWMQNIAHQRVDMSPYLKLLREVQKSEMLKCCYSAICFILQPIGMGYLTNVIWHGKSAISECSDITKLQHIRWLPDVDWAPWNTILLTEQEAKLHTGIPDIFQFYDDTFIQKVYKKHIRARKQFIPLLIMDHDICLSGDWSKVTDSGVFLHPSHAEQIANQNDDYDTI